MEVRDFGKIIIVLSIALLVISVYSASKIVELNKKLHEGCNLPEAICPYATSVPIEQAVAFVLGLGFFAAGFYLKSMPKVRQAMQQVAPSRITGAKIKKISASLPADEKRIYNIITASQGFIFQNELIEKSGFNKVAMTRLLDKLEGKGLVERRRRGMSNVIVLRHS